MKKITFIACLIGLSCTLWYKAYPLEEKRMMVIVPSYNNSKWYKWNLDSVFTQNYNNFHVIYVDDMSPDGTGDLVEAYVSEKGQGDRVTVIKNKRRMGALANIYNAVHSCDDNVIIITLDGDDAFKNPEVLARVNQEYAKKDVWLTYGQYEHYPNGKPGDCRTLPQGVIIKNVYREYDWVTSHLRTFYAKLFKAIKLEDLLHEGSFFNVTWDLAFMYPMLEMAGGRIAFIPDVLYQYNIATGQNDFKLRVVEQIHCNKLISSRPKYNRLKENLFRSGTEHVGDALLFSDNNPFALSTLLETLTRYAMGLGDVHVLYRADDINKNYYNKIKQDFSEVHFVEYSSGKFKPSLLQILAALSHDYVLFGHDGAVVKDFLDLPTSIAECERTQAHGLYFALGTNIIETDSLEDKQSLPAAVRLTDELYAWQFKDGEHDWRKPQSLTMALYRKATVESTFKKLRYSSPEGLEVAWNREKFDLYKVGLFWKESKAIVIKDQDKKVDGADFFKMANAAIYVSSGIAIA